MLLTRLVPCHDSWPRRTHRRMRTYVARRGRVLESARVRMSQAQVRQVYIDVIDDHVERGPTRCELAHV